MRSRLDPGLHPRRMQWELSLTHWMKNPTKVKRMTLRVWLGLPRALMYIALYVISNNRGSYSYLAMNSDWNLAMRSMTFSIASSCGRKVVLK